MTNEELIQNVLNMTIDRIGKQTVAHESEIANLNAQLLVLNDKVNELSKSSGSKNTTKEPSKDS
jgi:uncharacterized coiled-coil protein SlyX